MLTHISFFYGHRGSVLALAEAENGSFFSSGAEGLIVKWDLANPDDGQVLQKLPGYATSLVFDKADNLLYSALNHVGIYVLEADRGKIINKIDLPLVSFKSLHIVDNYLIITSLKGELLLIDKHTYKIVKRVNTSLGKYTIVAIDMNQRLWYNTSKGLVLIDLNTLKEELVQFQNNLTNNSFGIKKDYLISLSKNIVEIQKISKRNLIASFTNSTIDLNSKLIIRKNEPEFFVVSTINSILHFELSKNKILFKSEAFNEHNGEINQLLWIESHKFVITASVDKKIGIWKYN